MFLKPSDLHDLQRHKVGGTNDNLAGVFFPNAFVGDGKKEGNLLRRYLHQNLALVSGFC